MCDRHNSSMIKLHTPKTLTFSVTYWSMYSGALSSFANKQYFQSEEIPSLCPQLTTQISGYPVYFVNVDFLRPIKKVDKQQKTPENSVTTSHC